MNHFYLTSKSKYKTELAASKSYYQKEGVGISVFEEACIIPWGKKLNETTSGGVLDRNGNLISGSTITEALENVNYESFEDPISVDEDVIFVGNFIPIWGHAITDNLKKIWFLYTDQYKGNLQRLRFVCIVHYGQTLPAYVLRLLELAGVEIKKLEVISRPTRFRRVYIPDNSIICDKNEIRYYNNFYLQTVTHIKDSVHIKTDCLKVYYTRTHLPKGRDIGEPIVEDQFRRHGYQIIAPEEYSVDEQIALLKNCKYFAATEGSISHSAVFCAPETNVCIIRKCDYVNPYQMMINEMSRLNVSFVDAHHSVLAKKNNPWLGPFYLYDSIMLRKFFGDNIFWRFPYFFYPSWWWYRYGEYEFMHKINKLVHRLCRK